MAVDGFDVEVPDNDANAAEFGCAGAGSTRLVFPKVRVVALAECGTHMVVATEAERSRPGRRLWATGSARGRTPTGTHPTDRDFYGAIMFYGAI